VTFRPLALSVLATPRGVGAPMHNGPSPSELPMPRHCFGPKTQLGILYREPSAITLGNQRTDSRCDPGVVRLYLMFR